MRKSAAIVLLICFGFYQLGFFAMQFLMPLAIHNHWDQQIWAEGHKSSPSGKLVRVPFPMPYGQNQEDFQSVNFPMEIDGKIHRVIKQRYFEDHLEVIVVQDDLQMNFEAQARLWISSIVSDQGDFDGPPLQKALLKSFVKDFVAQSVDWQHSAACFKILIVHSSTFIFGVPIGNEDIKLQPPRHLSFS